MPRASRPTRSSGRPGTPPARLTIRDPRPSDRTRLARWNRELAVHIARALPRYLATDLPARYGAVYVADRLGRIQRNGGFVLIAQWDGRPVGFVALDLPRDPSVLERWEGRPTVIAHVQDVYLDPNARGRGIGKALFREAERRLRALAVDALYLHAATTNRGALRFYRRLGFATDQVRFRKTLATPPRSWASAAARRARARRSLRPNARTIGRTARTR